jgi:hypothetical protein
MYSIGDYGDMIADTVRMDPFAYALKAKIGPDSILNRTMPFTWHENWLTRMASPIASSFFKMSRLMSPFLKKQT